MASKTLEVSPEIKISTPCKNGYQLTKGLLDSGEEVDRQMQFDFGNQKIKNEASSMPVNALSRIIELERNMKFLKKEQKSVLASLQEEIFSLREKNRDLMFQLILHSKDDSEENQASTNVKYILTSHDKDIICPLVHQPHSVSADTSQTISELRYTIDQQQREIVYLTEQLHLASIRDEDSKKRKTENYIKRLENRIKNHEKSIGALQKENVEYKIECNNLRHMLQSGFNGNVSQQNIRVAQLTTQAAPMFPQIASGSWCSGIQLSDYQLVRSGNNGRERPSTMPNVGFALPPITNYRSIQNGVQTSPVPLMSQFFNNLNPPPQFYDVQMVAASSIARTQSYTTYSNSITIAPARQ